MWSQFSCLFSLEGNIIRINRVQLNTQRKSNQAFWTTYLANVYEFKFIEDFCVLGIDSLSLFTLIGILQICIITPTQ